MKQLLDKVMNQQILSEHESADFILKINNETGSTELITAILIAIQFRGVQLEELRGFRRALIELSSKVDLNPENAIDLCGTGGDGKNTFNISTTTSLVLAAMGKKVIKHGNYGISSACGSSNVVEALGFEMSSNNKVLEKQLNDLNICFLHAPLFHPTLKKIATLRKNLGVRTLFNSIGPLVNPCQTEFQMTGTFSLDLAKSYQHLLRNNRKNYKVIHGLDGYDELTLTNRTRIISKDSDMVKDAKSYFLATIPLSEINAAETIKDNTSLVRDILLGKGTRSQNAVISVNVAEALNCFDSKININEAVEETLNFIQSGQVAKHFKFK